MLKKYLSVSGVILGCIISSTSFAHVHSYKGEVIQSEPMIQASSSVVPYVGVSASYLHLNYASSVALSDEFVLSPSKIAPNNFGGWGLLSGVKLNKFFGLEFAYTDYPEQSKTVTYSDGTTSRLKVHPSSLSLNSLFYYPVQTELNLIGEVGFRESSTGAATWDLKNNSNSESAGLPSESSYGVTVGAGAEYMFTPVFGLRGLVNYTFLPSNSDRYVDSNYGASVSLLYNIIA